MVKNKLNLHFNIMALIFGVVSCFVIIFLLISNDSIIQIFFTNSDMNINNLKDIGRLIIGLYIFLIFLTPAITIFYISIYNNIKQIETLQKETHEKLLMINKEILAKIEKK